MKIGILREEKKPHDSRVPLTPSQCRLLMERYPNLSITVQPSPHRCYSNEEYLNLGVHLMEDLSDCDVLLGVKEIPPHLFLEDKTYIIFSHTIKAQPHNRQLLQTCLQKNVRLIDWECIRDERGLRLIAFGRWAGIVGAYHAIRMIGLRTGRYHIRQLSDCHNFAEGQREFFRLNLPNWKILLTGTGRVAGGAAFLLDIMNVRKVSAIEFLEEEFNEPVYTQLSSSDMYKRKDGLAFNRSDFHSDPEHYVSALHPFLKRAEVLINGIYWDKNIPAFFSREEMQMQGFKVCQIADITCDIAPDASVPTTIRASTISAPYYGLNPMSFEETQPFTGKDLDIMAIDNLPNELPRDASEDFGNMFSGRVIEELIKPFSEVILNATICDKLKLGKGFGYLKDYVEKC
jgi:alanine dehydrogenase